MLELGKLLKTTATLVKKDKKNQHVNSKMRWNNSKSKMCSYLSKAIIPSFEGCINKDLEQIATLFECWLHIINLNQKQSICHQQQ